jgi:hypothetical protein
MKKIYKWSLALLIPVLLTGCFDLEEKAYSKLLKKILSRRNRMWHRCWQVPILP